MASSHFHEHINETSKKRNSVDNKCDSFKEEEFRIDNKCDLTEDLIAFFPSTNTRRNRVLGIKRKVSFSSVKIRQYNRILFIGAK